ncbi:MAG: hypothetical protein Q9175_004792 [Cornicularia normoerica]
MESLHTNKNNNTTTLPSPPSVKATESDSGRNENGLHLVEVVGGELTVSGNRSKCRYEGHGYSSDVVNDEPSSGQPPNDPKQEGAKSQDKYESSAKKDDKTTIDIDGEEEISDAESVHKILDQMRWDTLYPLIASDTRPFQERIKKGPKCAVQ